MISVSDSLSHSSDVISVQAAEEKTEEKTEQYLPSAFVKEVLGYLTPGFASVATMVALVQPLRTQITLSTAPEGSDNHTLALARYDEFVTKIFWLGLFGLIFLWSRLSLPTLPTWLPHYKRCCFFIDEIIGISSLFSCFAIYGWLISEQAAIGIGVVLFIVLIQRFVFLPDPSWWRKQWLRKQWLRFVFLLDPSWWKQWLRMLWKTRAHGEKSDEEDSIV